MAFSLKTWVDRLAEFPNRRRLESTGITDTYDVVRDEGTVTTEGDKINAANMNDLEERIAAGLEDVEAEIPTALPNPNSLTFTGGVTGSYNGSAAKSVAIPIALPNPNAITFSVGLGGYTGAYTGAATKTVSIPHIVLSTTDPSTVGAAGTIYGVY